MNSLERGKPDEFEGDMKENILFTWNIIANKHKMNSIPV